MKYPLGAFLYGTSGDNLCKLAGDAGKRVFPPNKRFRWKRVSRQSRISLTDPGNFQFDRVNAGIAGLGNKIASPNGVSAI